MTVLFLAAALALPEMPSAYRVDRDAAAARAAEATAIRYADADTVLVANATHVEYFADGTYIQWEESWTKALTEKGRRGLRSCTIGEDGRYGSAEIQAVEILGEDGRMRAVDFASTLRKATDNSSESSNIYDPLDRRITCSVPGIRVGETLRTVVCERMTKTRMKDAFATASTFEGFRPVLEDVFTVIQPAGRPIVSVKLRNPVENTVTRDEDRPTGDGRTLLRWTARNVPQAFPEPGMPSFGTVAQGVLVSTLKDWREVSRWYWRLCEPHLAKTNAAMKAETERLVKGCATPDARIRALFKFVSQEVRYMGLTLEDDSPGYAPHDVDVTFRARAGVCRDKAALLVALLRTVGFEAYPVLIQVGAKKDPDVPMPYFNHAIVGVRAPDGTYALMDPTNESTKDVFPAYLMNRSYLVAHPVGESLMTSPVSPAAENAMRVTTEGGLDLAGNAVLRSRFAFGGINDTSYRGALLRRTPEGRRDLFAALLRGAAPGAELLSFSLVPADLRDTETPLAVELVARVPDVVLRGETRDSISVPFLSEGFGAAEFLLEGKTALETRRFPLLISTTAENVETVTMKLGDGVGALTRLPAPFEEKAGGYTVSRRYAVTNGVLTAERRRTLGSVEYTPDEYADLREVRKAAETAARETPLFAARGTAAEANVRLLSSATDVRLLSPRRYTVTNVWEKEILTPAGKTASAELKYSWNPCVESFELLGATVSNRNGTVQTAGPKETTFLDAGWVASAPRYPAGRRMIVNLPGVETGSVIRVTTVSVVTNAPVPYTAFALFDSTEPLGVKSWRVTAAGDGDEPPVPFLAEGRHVPFGPRTELLYAVTNPASFRREPSQPPSSLWRDWVTVSSARFEDFAEGLLDALAAARDAGSERACALAEELTAHADTPETRIKAIRDALVKRVRVAGPGLYALPFEHAFFPPDRSLEDGYASEGDWMNLYFTMLEAAGFDVAFELADNDAGGIASTKDLKKRVPRPTQYGQLVIRVEWTEGGFFGLGGETRTLHLERENEYMPVGATTLEGEELFDLEEGTFAALGPGPLPDRAVSKSVISLRSSGEADFDVTVEHYGSAVGGMRKLYAEMLPEMKWRHYRQLLGAIAESATATSELDADTTGYPFRLSFRAYVPGYATVHDGVMTLRIGAYSDAAFDVGGPERHTPILVPVKRPDEEVREIVFPAGFTEIEHLPPSYEIAEGARCDVTHEMRDGRLVITLHCRAGRARDLVFGADFFPYFSAWNRRTKGLPARTITVRKTALKKN